MSVANPVNPGGRRCKRAPAGCICMPFLGLPGTAIFPRRHGVRQRTRLRGGQAWAVTNLNLSRIGASAPRSGTRLVATKFSAPEIHAPLTVFSGGRG